jgi:hypothetical protein
MARVLIAAAIAVFLMVAGVAWFFSYRNQQMNRLYTHASGGKGDFIDATEAVAAVEKLARYRGARSSQLLMRIADGPGPFLGLETQMAAIKGLAGRSDPEIGTFIAALLQPHQPLVVREAAQIHS